MLTTDQLDSLKIKHPGTDLYALGDDAETVVVRPPSLAEWKAFKAMAREGGNKAVEAPGWLLGTCRVWPEDADAIFARRPALVDTYANKLAEIAGVDERVTAKKL